jgi:sugar transferase EpsL
MMRLVWRSSTVTSTDLLIWPAGGAFRDMTCRYIVKRSLDIFVAAVSLTVFSPVILAISLLLVILQGTPIFFVQPRPGRNSQLFHVIKFRTMTDARGANGRLLSDDARLTSFGRWLRKTSLDELPQMINVLKGEMSLVGPRPLLVRYLSRYDSEQMRRQEVLPGLTSWSAVNGRNTPTWEEKLAMDVWYVDNWSVFLDLRVLARTVSVVISRKGTSKQGHATEAEFWGTMGPHPDDVVEEQ